MKILLVTRGSQGDVYPYLAIASELVRRGHEITLNLPRIFEKQAKEYGLNYVLQEEDAIESITDGEANKSDIATPYLKWVRDVTEMQFRQMPALLEKHDILVSTNTEFAAASVAEYCRKPCIRTAYGPFLPGKKIPPPIFPLPKPGFILRPKLLWTFLNKCSDLMTKKTINRNRMRLGLKPLKKPSLYATEACHNYLLYSRYLGNTDPDWKYRWDIGGYCFNDTLVYEEDSYRQLMDFIRKDIRPVLFFTLGSCSAKNGDIYCERLANICQKSNYKLIIGSGWSGAGTHLSNTESLFLMRQAVPHTLIFPHCDAVIHHGGAGTTHSVARAGIPQAVLPMIIDQHYWGYRIKQLKIGPGSIKINRVSDKKLEATIRDLMTNKIYKKNAAALAIKVRSEKSISNLCDFIESFAPTSRPASNNLSHESPKPESGFST